MTLHLLDTNIVSHIIRRDQTVVQKRLRELATEDVAISAVTKGEMLYGLAKRTKTLWARASYRPSSKNHRCSTLDERNS